MSDESRNVNVNLTPVVVTLPPPGVGIATRFNASGVLWWNAAFFADRCGQLEEKYRLSFFDAKGEWTPIERVEREHRAFAIAAMTHSLFAVEAGINEFYHDVRSGTGNVVKAIGDAAYQKLLSEPIPKSTWGKANWALTTAGKTGFKDDESPGQEFDGLRTLRNAIAHYRPEWSHEQGEHAELAVRLSARFAANPLWPSGKPWFPYRCFGAGCAAWSVTVAEKFMREFCDRLGLPFWFASWEYEAVQTTTDSAPPTIS